MRIYDVRTVSVCCGRVFFNQYFFLIYNKNRLYIHMSGEAKGVGGGMLVKMLFFYTTIPARLFPEVKWFNSVFLVFPFHVLW